MKDNEDTENDNPNQEPRSTPSTSPEGPLTTVDKPNVDPSSVRGTVGIGMHQFTQLLNENLIAARYGIFAGVTLLTVYGLSQTPLFFRYRTVADVPASSFIARKRLYGRIMGVESIENGNANSDIQIYVRHLSPIGQILPKSWFDFLVKYSPQSYRVGSSSGSNTIPDTNSRELLRVKIAGIHPPPVLRLTYEPEHFLDRLAREKTLISCQLLARQIEPVSGDELLPSKRPMSDVMPELVEQTNGENDSEKKSPMKEYNQKQEVAICRVTYRPTLFQLFPTDVAESLIAAGNANVSSNILGRESAASDPSATSTVIKDSSQRLQDLRNDVRYLDRLAKSEFEAARQSMGMWSVPEVRDSRKEVIEEVEFRSKATILQKLWKWLRGQ